MKLSKNSRASLGPAPSPSVCLLSVGDITSPLQTSPSSTQGALKVAVIMSMVTIKVRRFHEAHECFRRLTLEFSHFSNIFGGPPGSSRQNFMHVSKLE